MSHLGGLGRYISQYYFLLISCGTKTLFTQPLGRNLVSSDTYWYFYSALLWQLNERVTWYECRTIMSSGNERGPWPRINIHHPLAFPPSITITFDLRFCQYIADWSWWNVTDVSTIQSEILSKIYFSNRQMVSLFRVVIKIGYRGSGLYLIPTQHPLLVYQTE